MLPEGTISNAEIEEWYALALKASQTDWQVGHSDTKTHEDAIKWQADMISKKDATDLWLVCFGNVDEHNVMDDALTVACTGNGPTSEANAYYLAACKPSNVMTLLVELQRERNEVKRLTHILLRDQSQ